MSKNNEALRQLYANLLTEMRARRVLVREILDKQQSLDKDRLPDFASFELCYLQLRMLCELIALACLTAHGDIKETRTRKLLSTYEPDRIIKALERLHPEFYPQPFEQVIYPEGSRITGELKAVTAPYLTKADLLKLHAECGGFLHRGAAIHLAPRHLFNFLKIRDWHDKMLRLLKVHVIQLIDPDYQLWGLSNHDDTGLGQASLFKRVDRPTPH